MASLFDQSSLPYRLANTAFNFDETKYSDSQKMVNSGIDVVATIINSIIPQPFNSISYLKYPARMLANALFQQKQPTKIEIKNDFNLNQTRTNPAQNKISSKYNQMIDQRDEGREQYKSKYQVTKSEELYDINQKDKTPFINLSVNKKGYDVNKKGYDQKERNIHDQSRNTSLILSGVVQQSNSPSKILTKNDYLKHFQQMNSQNIPIRISKAIEFANSAKTPSAISLIPTNIYSI